MTFHPGKLCIDRGDAFDAAVKGKAGLNITYNEVTVPGQVQNGNAIAQPWLTAHPAGGKKPLAIWACWDEPMQGAVAALRQAGRDDVTTVAINGSPQAMQLVKDGDMTATVWQPAYQEGKAMFQAILDSIAAGKSWQPKTIAIPGIVVTKDKAIRAGLVVPASFSVLLDAIFMERAQRTGRFLRRADRGAQIHQRLRAVAGARGARGAEQRRRQLLDQRLGLRQRLLDREQPRHHALDIAVDRHGPAAERDRGDRGRGVGPDPRQRAQAFLGIGKRAAMIAQHRHRAGVQIARPRIIAEPRPHPQHVVQRGATSASTSGQRARNFSKYGATVLTPVCCSMISDSHTRYGSARSPAAAATAAGGDAGRTSQAAARGGPARLRRRAGSLSGC